MRFCVLWIEFYGALEQAPRFSLISSVVHWQGIAAQHTLICGQASWWLAFCTISTVGLQPSYEGTNDCPNDPILDVEQLFQGPIKSIRPDMVPG
ncbi:hypothetical protein SAMN05192541_113169 [Bradyrhizobium arachidis]|nr:hypothetical protein SAMN05192541_113169 [Bradyrhizobium arachidis]